MNKTGNKGNYIPNPINTDDIALSESLIGLVDELAENVHEEWAKARMAEGWVYGEERNASMKTHPCLVPYEKLPESEKSYDRQTVVETLKLVMKLGYTITPNSGT